MSDASNHNSVGQLTAEQEHNIKTGTQKAVNQRNLPIWLITHKDDKEIRQNLKTAAWKRCDEFVAAFVECSKSAGLMIFPKCSPQREVLHNCLLHYQRDEFIEEQVDLYLEEKLKKMEERMEQSKVVSGQQ